MSLHARASRASVGFAAALLAISAALSLGGCDPNAAGPGGPSNTNAADTPDNSGQPDGGAGGAGGDGDAGDDGAGSDVLSASALISADEGGIIETPDGYSLDIPGGAMAQDTQITITPVSAARLAGLDPALIAGAILEPEGLTFSAPATLRVPLGAAWPHDDPPMELEFAGTDPARAEQTGALVTLSDDRTAALFEVRHFSGKICANQCHAGVREWLTARFAARGCSFEDWSQRVRGKFPDVELSVDCQFISPSEIQAILDTFFEEVGGADAGVDVPPLITSAVEGFANSGRELVFAFWKDAAGSRGGAQGFYRGLAHTAVAEQRFGAWQIRNALRVAGDEATVLDYLGGTNLVWWPMADLNGFRNAERGVPVERQFCGGDGCLTEYFGPLEKRLVPWAATRIYVEREGNVPCQRLAGCWAFDVDSDGTVSTLLLRLDEQGEIESLWFKTGATTPTPEEPLPRPIYTEYMRFTRPNAGEFAPYLADVAQIVNQTSDQSQFDATLRWSMLGEDGNGGKRLSSEVLIRITDARMSINQAAESFTGLYEQGVINYSYDQEGNRTSENTTLTSAIAAVPVACPDVAAGTGIPQEQLAADWDFDLCGAGAGGTMPLMLAGLASMRIRAGRRRTPPSQRGAVCPRRSSTK